MDVPFISSSLGSVDVDGDDEVTVLEVNPVTVLHDSTLVEGVDDDRDTLSYVLTIGLRELNRLHQLEQHLPHLPCRGLRVQEHQACRTSP